MTSEEETACRRQPGLRRGCRVHAVSSAEVVEAVRGGAVRKILRFVSMPWTWARAARSHCLQILRNFS